MNSIAKTVNVLLQVIAHQRSLTLALADARLNWPEEIAVISEMSYGTLRWLIRLETVLAQLAPKSFKKKDADIKILILVGLYQLNFMQSADYAVVKNSVDCALSLKKDWAKGVINAVLRNFIRQKEPLLKSLVNDPNYQYSHPLWLKDLIEAAWNNQAPDIFNANNQRPPLTLRLNTQKISREKFIEILKIENISSYKTDCSPYGVTLDKPCAIYAIPLYADGLWSVQDEAAQLVAPLLDLQPNLHVLDACAAPGGKSIHMLAQEPTLQLTCIDKDETRILKLKENIERSRSHAILKAAKIQDVTCWWSGKTFDRILCDPPCSGTGVIRRHPDIKILKSEKDLDALKNEQYELLKTLWPLLSVGGIFLYTTCSILPEENELQLIRFLQETPNAKLYPIEAPWGITRETGKQILPGDHNMDGFFYGRMVKIKDDRA